MILFLDFDGVLHLFAGVARADSFAGWPRLEAVLDEHPHVDLVVSSSWRSIPHDEWERDVPASLRARVVGRTPVIRRPLRVHYPTGYKPEPLRYLEILRYLKTTRQQHRPWLALDDDATLFPAGCPNLVLCRDRFGDDEERVLRELVARMLP
ncbi:hypothetical protein LLG90_24095 [Aromatoleum toluclasticum]|uniref:HAD domain-containing protein n=1 Tax=Aromatoleum toluclasticum TaxID=92003 RepID=UPI001D184E3C|nr:HAD domain-containing protein [Aromatoleum toluclasticum]MCC4118443.1 hypothetical protein [Aromatoleum toluclasticum]